MHLDAGHGQGINLLRKGFDGGKAKRPLDLSQDRAEMRHDHKVALMVRNQRIGRRIDARGQIVPAFAPGGRDIAGFFPEAPDQGGVARLGLGEAQAFPGAEVNFPQRRQRRQRPAAADCGGRLRRAAQVG